MGIDLEKIKQRKQALENKGGGNNNFWRPQDGDQSIRIVPTPDGDNGWSLMVSILIFFSVMGSVPFCEIHTCYKQVCSL